MLLFAFGLAVAVRAGIVMPAWQPLSRKAVWGVVAYCVVGVIANAFTPSRPERLVWLPVALGMLATAVIVSTS